MADSGEPIDVMMKKLFISAIELHVVNPLLSLHHMTECIALALSMKSFYQPNDEISDHINDLIKLLLPFHEQLRKATTATTTEEILITEVKDMTISD